MTWVQLEKSFNRSFAYSFDREKCLFVFPALIVCGLLCVICRMIAFKANAWVQISLVFLPIFLTFAILLCLGVTLIEIYRYQVKGEVLSYKEAFTSTKPLYASIPYIALPLIFSFLMLWILLGIFYLLRAIPSIGPFISAILSFAPFLLMVGALFLLILSVWMMFYLVPAAIFQRSLHFKMMEELMGQLKANPFQSVVFPFLGLLPIGLIVGLLFLAAMITQTIYVDTVHPVAISLKWVFMMIPFAALLTPCVVFLFNFAAESYVFIQSTFLKK